MPLLMWIALINKTLTEIQGTGWPRPPNECDNRTSVRCTHDGPYAAQLQLVRTL